MAVLTDQQRAEVRAWLARRGACPAAVTKPDHRAGVNAMDTELENQVAAFIAALPEPFKSASSASEKALTLAAIAAKRAGVDL